MTKSGNEADIMVVDDTPEIRGFLTNILRKQGYRVRAFDGGRCALAAAAEQPPDLILLDVCMPDMDGYETCERVKASPWLAAIPIIFISALDQTWDKMRAFQCGAIDYVTKPLQYEEVRARVDTHLQLRQLQQRLERRNERLSEVVAVRTRQLSEAHERLAILDKAKSDFLDLISHELRTPLTGLLGVGELLLGRSASTPDYERLENLYQQSRLRLLRIVDDALLLARIDVRAGKLIPQPVPLASVLGLAAEEAGSFAQARNVALEVAPDSPGWVTGERELLVKALRALMETAVRFSKPGESVQVSCHTGPSEVRCLIGASGRGIPADLVPKFFGVFSVNEAITPGGDLGLAPPVAERIISLFGGSVAVESLDPPGIRLTVTLKSATAATATPEAVCVGP
jgi:DNA-binding response OmpR family regulator